MQHNYDLKQVQELAIPPLFQPGEEWNIAQVGQSYTMKLLKKIAVYHENSFATTSVKSPRPTSPFWSHGVTRNLKAPSASTPISLIHLNPLVIQ